MGERLLSNDSTTGGYLAPTGESPPYDADLERLISRWIRGVTGLDTALVYPRWTDPQKAIPQKGKTWCAFGITTIPDGDSPAFIQSEESTEQWIHETVEVLCCFYGPQGMSVAAQFKSAMLVPQNNAELNKSGLTLQQCGRIYNLPELINNQWVRRYDLSIQLRRKVIRTYNVKSFLDGDVTISTGE